MLRRLERRPITLFKIEKLAEGNTTVLRLVGRINAEHLDELNKLIGNAEPRVVKLNLSEVTLKFNVLFAGGSFGRRGLVDSHLVREASAIAKHVRGKPVKLVFTREDDMRSGYYRPMFAHRVEVGIGADGAPLAWRHVVVGQAFVKGNGYPVEALLVKNGVDHLAVEGSDDSPYDIPNVDLTAHHPTVECSGAVAQVSCLRA